MRLPFRFGVVTLTESPQAFVRARIRIEDGQMNERESLGAAAELLAPKWFDKNLALTNEDNFDQLRRSLAIACSAYLSGGAISAFGHFSAHYRAQIEACAGEGLNSLVACYGPALIDRALLDALCRALGIPFYAAMRANLPGVDASLTADLDGFDLADFLGSLEPAASIAARHTVGLLDPITAADQKERVGDGLPETLEEVVAHYGHNFFKLKVGGDIPGDVARLGAIAAVLDRSREPYFASLDGNEQYGNVEGIVELWRRMTEAPELRRLAASLLFIEQPIKRKNAGGRRERVGALPSRDHRRVRRYARRIFTRARSRLCGCVVQDLQGPVQIGPQCRALREVEFARRNVLHVGGGPHHPAGACAAAGPGAGEPARHHARGAERAPLRERHGVAARIRTACVSRGASGPLRVEPRRDARRDPQWPARDRFARLPGLRQPRAPRFCGHAGDEARKGYGEPGFPCN